MDDEKTIDTTTYKLVIANEEYEFGKPDPDLLARMVLISHMSAGGLLTMEALTKWLSSAAGPVVWQAIMKRFLDGSVSVEDLVQAMGEFVKLIAGEQGSTADAA